MNMMDQCGWNKKEDIIILVGKHGQKSSEIHTCLTF